MQRGTSTMTAKTRKKLHNRSRLARQLLLSELRLVRHYARAISDITIPQADRDYMAKVVTSWNKLMRYARNFPDGAQRVKFIETALMGDCDMTGACDTLHISTSTYYNWRNAMVKAFGMYMGVCVTL